MFRGRVWPNTKAQLKAAIAALHREQPAWLVQWIGQTLQLTTPAKKWVKSTVRIFKAQWSTFGVLHEAMWGTALSSGRLWDQAKIAAVLDAHTPLRSGAAAAAGGASLGLLSELPPQRPTAEELSPASIRLASGEEVELVRSRERFETTNPKP
jgi:hypothetical protein